MFTWHNFESTLVQYTPTLMDHKKYVQLSIYIIVYLCRKKTLTMAQAQNFSRKLQPLQQSLFGMDAALRGTYQLGWLNGVAGNK